jgi:YidC/Oxa1 family membrane protein insertase
MIHNFVEIIRVNMDDKRTLLGFLIIGLIFLLSPYYYEWMGLTPEPEGPAESELVELADTVAEPAQDNAQPIEMSSQQTQLKVDSQPIDSSESNKTQTSESSFVNRQINVQTPYLDLIFSTEGGLLVSSQLREYNLPDGRPVQLLTPGGRGLILSLQQLDKITDLSHIEFVPNREQVKLDEGQETLKLSAQLGQGRVIEKVFTFYADHYGFDFEVRYEGFSEDVDAFITWQGGIAFTEKRPDIDLPEMGALALFNDERMEIKVDDGESETWTDKGILQWAGVRNKYFLSAIIPSEQEGRFRAVLRGDHKGSSPVPNYSYEVGRQLSLRGSWNNTVYLGPLNYENLTRYSEGFEQAIDFGWPVINQVSKFILIVFKKAHNYIPNYGWIIVLFAVVIKIIVYPLTHKTYESAGKMQELQPKIAALKEKHKNDNQRLSQETMKLYKEEGVNPLGGCLPMVLQMPIFMALYNIFGKTIELRQAPFTLWITDLSVPDEVLVAGFGLHILPLLMSLSMLIQQKMTMKDPKQAFLVYAMPVFMIFIFWSMSSGLVLYWTLFNVFTIFQQILVNHFKKDSIPSISR